MIQGVIAERREGQMLSTTRTNDAAKAARVKVLTRQPHTSLPFPCNFYSHINFVPFSHPDFTVTHFQLKLNYKELHESEQHS